MPSGRITVSYGNFIPMFLGNLHIILHSGCINLHSRQHCRKVLFSLHPLQPSLFCGFFDDGHFVWCEMISHHSFDLRFSNNEQLQLSFHVFIGHLCVFFGEKSCLWKMSKFCIWKFSHLNFVVNYISPQLNIPFRNRDK